tara:strand:- start:6 stop:224 length:219 start_codon:yes stop_codon:yes gene_type:complete
MNNLNMAEIQLNGVYKEIKSGSTITQLLITLNIEKSKVAIEINGQIIEKSNYSNFILNKNDKVEIVHFIGGG